MPNTVNHVSEHPSPISPVHTRREGVYRRTPYLESSVPPNSWSKSMKGWDEATAETPVDRGLLDEAAVDEAVVHDADVDSRACYELAIDAKREALDRERGGSVTAA